MLSILKREIQGYIYTPTGYVFLGVFLLLSGVCYAILNLAARSSNMLYTLEYMGYLWMLLCPVLVMRLFAGEQYRHTDKLLSSSPLPITAIVLGKFFAACIVMLCSVAVSFVYPLLTAVYGKLYLAETLAAYTSFVLQGIAFIAMDLFISTLSHNQFTAAISCIGVNLFFWLADLVSEAFGSALIERIFTFISLYRRSSDFSMGRISFSNCVFYIVFTIVMLFLCVRILDGRRWHES